MNAEDQFRISKLQVFNWGTFSGVHDIPIARRGFLMVGRSGTGKTTLLDAFSALLVPPRWIDFNAAAREGERSGRDRSLVSYVRGAWAEQQDDDSGQIATQYLRTGTTWSGLALSYLTEAGRTVVLVQLFWMRGKSTSRDDLRRYFLILERPFDLREIQDFKLDIRKLKQQLPEAFGREDFAPYGERFRRLLGIDNELALRLLHKTQSAKNLGDLNTFLREFMLDKPETFAAADRLVAEFADLNEAHQAVVIAREQVQTLTPARTNYQELQTLRENEKNLRDLRAAVDGYKETCRAGLIGERLKELATELAARQAEEEICQANLENDTAALRDLQRQQRESGGQQIEDLGAEKRRIEETRGYRLRKRNETQAACQKLGIPVPATPQALAEMAAGARHELETWPDWQEEYREKYAALAAGRDKAQAEFAAATEEVESLRRQSSSVPVGFLKLRARIASELGLAEDVLPFAAELIEVLPREVEWRGAIERVLRGFALSLLVAERYYPAVSELVDHSSVGERLLYNRVGRAESQASRNIQPNSLARKVEVKSGMFATYLESELKQHFDFACVDSLQAFRTTDWALTRRGQIRRGKSRHEKDDRFDINDPTRWVLGFDNAAKRMLFERKAQQAAQAIEDWNRRIRNLNEEERKRRERALHCQTLVNVQWIEIDAAPLLDRIAAIDRTLLEVREKNATLREIDRQLAAQEKQQNASQNRLIHAKSQIDSIQKEERQRQKDLERVRASLHLVVVSDWQAAELNRYFGALDQKLTLENADRLAHQVDRTLDQEQKVLAEGSNRLTNGIEKRFAEFKRNWALDAGDLDATLASAPDFFSILKRLETDRLPDYEHRFFDLLRNQSHQNLAALATHISQARKTIFDRLEIVNQSLSHAEFNTGTYLHIDASDRNLEEVREFRQEVQKALSHAWTDDREEAEARFVVLRGLVEQLASQDADKKRWRTLVLDVRLHVEFLGREADSEGKQVEVYQGGAGKSGGQRQKLATTCLAAALRYQLGGEDHAVPQYAPVVLDEAFDKADNEFTAQAMTIFAKFGFQMIVATPLKSVMTLEPFIGGACFVDITERRHSGVLMIEYDLERQRLKLPERIHGAAVQTAVS